MSIVDIPRFSNKKIKVMCDMCHDVRMVYAHQFFARKTDLCIGCSSKSRTVALKTGDVFGRWTVIHDTNRSTPAVSCKCQCGTIRDVDRTALRCGASKSCGCVTKEKNGNRRRVITTGTVLGRLIVLNASMVPGKSICRCQCGDVKEFDNGNLLDGTTMSCGCYRKEQASKHMSKLCASRTGAKHPRWKGGISADRGRFDARKETKEWKQQIYARDGYVCSHCKQVGHKLNVHHIYPYSEYPALRLDMDNGCTLCKKCHKEFHGAFGRKGIGIEEIEKFLSEAA